MFLFKRWDIHVVLFFIILRVIKFYLSLLEIYTTKGRDRFHWAATPLKPYKVGNISYMTYRYSVLYYLNLSLKHFFPTENGIFGENIQIRRPLSFRVITFAHAQSTYFPIEDIRHCTLQLHQFAKWHIHPVRHAKHPK